MCMQNSVKYFKKVCKIYLIEEVFKKKHSCGFIFQNCAMSLLYTHILNNTYLFH